MATKAEKAQHTPGPWLSLLDEEVNTFKVFGPRNEFVARIDALPVVRRTGARRGNPALP